MWAHCSVWPYGKKDEVLNALPQISLQRIVLSPPSSLGLLAESVGGKQYLQERKTASNPLGCT